MKRKLKPDAGKALGKVYLVGAGPGDPGLLTLKGDAVLRQADVIVYDYLANPELLLWARPDAELIPVHLENLNRILPKGEILPVPMLSRVVFGPRVDTSAGEDKQAFLTKARAAVIQLRAAS